MPADQLTAQGTWDALTCITTASGTRYWLNENRRFHREHGPAVIWPDGTVDYWIDGKRISEEQFNVYRNARE